MKDYSGENRTYLKFVKDMDSLGKPCIDVTAEDLMNDEKNVKHRAHISLNKPVDPQTCIDAKFAVVGLKHDELMAEAKKFQAEKGLDIDGNICMFVKFVLPGSGDVAAAAKLAQEVLSLDLLKSMMDEALKEPKSAGFDAGCYE